LHGEVRCPARLSQGACCRDIAVDCVSPSLVDAKRVGLNTLSLTQSLIRTHGSLESPIRASSFRFHSLGTDPAALRSVILLI
jgi:hypothetical protein